MSFGGSVRFDTSTTKDGKPAIYFGEEKKKKDKRKFGYKDKGLRHSLRNIEKEPENTDPAKDQKAEKQATNKKVADETKKPKNKGNEPKGTNPSQRRRVKETVNGVAPGTVTLTQEQLNAILSSLGQTQGSQPVQVSVDKNTNEVRVEKKEVHFQDEKSAEPAKVDSGTPREESIFNMVDSNHSDTGKQANYDNKQGTVSDFVLQQLGQSEEQGDVKQEDGKPKERENEGGASGASHIEGPKESPRAPSVSWKHMTIGERKRLQWARERGEQASGVNQSSPQQQNVASGQRSINDQMGNNPQPVKSPVMPVPPGEFVPQPQLSIAEKKKLQWEAERKQQEQQRLLDTWNPFGRPGAGAPMRSNSGTVLTDFNSRKNQSVQNSLDEKERKQKAYDQLQQQQQTQHQQEQQRQQPNFAPDPSTVHPAMRSSFAFGVATDGKFSDSKAEEKKRWLEELEKQKEENRMRKEAEKSKTVQAETWADKMSQPGGTPRTQNPVSNTPGVNIPGLQGAVASPRVNSAPSNVNNPAPNGELSSSGGASLLRGQNTLIDPVTMNELSEKRRRALEHQKAIQEQVEEHQRKKRVERERKIAEELAEEAKFQQQRENVQKQLELEQEKQKQKQEEQQKRVDDLKRAMDEATERARKEKFEKRLAHLGSHGHDTARLQEDYEAKYSPRAGAAGGNVEPASVPGLDLSNLSPRSGAQHESPRVAIQHEPYEENKVVIPSKYKQGSTDPMSSRREFGIQTELGQDDMKRTGSMDIEYEGPIHDQAKTKGKKVRVISAKKNSKKPEVEKETEEKPKRKGTQKISERPGWGQKAKKKPVKQSERDPFYERNKKQAEARKLKRAEELKAMIEANMKGIPENVVKRERSRSRSPPRDGGPSSHRSTTIQQGIPTPEIDSRTYESHARHSNAIQNNTSPPPERNRRRAQHSNPTPPPQSHRTKSPPIRTLNNKSQSKHHESPPHSHRSKSPPIPTLNHKNQSKHHESPRAGSILKNAPGTYQNQYDMDQHSYKNYHSQSQTEPLGKYQDYKAVSPPIATGDFVPFLRTKDILDPAHADSPCPPSRENSRMERARIAYKQGLNPANYGGHVEYYNDTKLENMMPERPPSKSHSKDPIFNPSVVLDHPTPRQDIILQQLSDIRKGLIQKQREIETCLSPSDLQREDVNY
ncbi:unnamed protein product [Owenia fusiformis]|uniref:Uncharacterized protein n=1 Tax=Owenia fusiformis TaxID=6347 RepID=A0A8J1T4P6_OWEFU|nr:unnamed protein product [Owenia fusiformis]